MANGYSKTFTLQDIFNNKQLTGILPLINYKQISPVNGKVYRSTSGKTVGALVNDISVKTARPFYTNMVHHKSGNTITIDGQTEKLDECVNAVYNNLMANRHMLIMTVNNADMIRDAIIEAAKMRRSPKLSLRVKSIAEIKGMSKAQLFGLMDDIMQNIFYSPEYAKTQAKYKVEDIPVKIKNYNYEQRRALWAEKVGL